MAEIRKIMLSIAVAMFSSLLLLTGCSSMSTENLEVDPDQFNVNDDSLDVADPDRFNVDDDPDRFNVDRDRLDPETDID